MIAVPYMVLPKSCNECVFARLKYQHPLWSKDEEKSGMYGYNCQLEYWKNGQYDTIREAKIDENVIPDNCLLRKVN